jgi:hypothetical protein
MTGHDELRAEDAVIHVPPDRYLKCIEADLACAEKRLAERKRRGPSPFTKSQVTTAIEGVQATGVQIAKVEVTREKITVETSEPEGAAKGRGPQDIQDAAEIL